MAAELDIETRSVCVGRYVLEIPTHLKRQQKNIDSRGDATFYFGRDENFTKVDATVLDARDKEAFQSVVLAREFELRQKKNFSTDGPMLVSRENVRPEVDVISSYASADSTEAVRLEVHALLGSSHVVLGETAYSTDAAATIQSRLVSMLLALRDSKDATRGEPGLCVGNIVFDLGNDYEEVEIAYAGGIDGTPVKLQLDINTFEQAEDEPALIERGEANLEGLGARPEKLRAGSRMLAGDAGDEWLGAFVENGQRMHGFYAETRTRKPTRESPKFQISLSTGDEDASDRTGGMDDGIAIALWDQILASSRKRL